MDRNITRDLIKPRRLDFENTDPRHGKFVAEPLERGYGNTIGNGLRRILLSSLPGAAITTARIEGVKHEFSSIPGCVEDVTEIVLNLKEVVLDLGEKDEIELRLQAKGPCEVTAGMIEGGFGVTILNPDYHIASLNDDGALDVSLTARKGRGYIVSEDLKGDFETELPTGTIVMDANYSPVRKVNFFVSSARVGQRTDYDKLTIELWTDGSIFAEDAVRGASFILRDQLSVFAGTTEEVHEPEVVNEEEKPRLNENLFRRIDELELSVRSSNCLENADIKYIGELVVRSEAEMLRTKNFGRKSLNEIKEILSEMNLGLGIKLENFPKRVELDQMYENSGGTIINN